MQKGWVGLQALCGVDFINSVADLVPPDVALFVFAVEVLYEEFVFAVGELNLCHVKSKSKLMNRDCTRTKFVKIFEEFCYTDTHVVHNSLESYDEFV